MMEVKIIKMFMVMVFVMVVLVEILMVGVDNYCLPLHQLRRKGQETPKKETRSSRGEYSIVQKKTI